jgi:CHASE1-domain containing sensor protein
MELFGVAIVVFLVGITLIVLVRSEANRRNRRARGNEARAALQRLTSSVCEPPRRPRGPPRAGPRR